MEQKPMSTVATSTMYKPGEVTYFPDKDGHGYPMMCWNNYVGIPPYPGGSARMDRFCAEWHKQSRDSDIFIFSYFKSGNHWMHEFVNMLQRGELTLADFKENYMVELVELETMEAMPSPRILNGHLPYSLLPEAVQKSKIVYMSRNPKSVAVSLYNHLTSRVDGHPMKYRGNWDAFLDIFIHLGQNVYEGNKGYWFEYQKDWQNILDTKPDNILHLQYESVKKNPIEAARRIAQFIGVDRNEEFLQGVANQTEFSNYKNLIAETNYAHPQGTNIYRKGSISDWKNWFTVAQNEAADQVYAKWLETYNGEPFEFE